MWAAGAAVLMMQPVPATFYNRPGADAALVAAERARCRAIATGPMVEGRALTAPVGAAESVLSSDADCMIARGWRLYRLSRGEQARLVKLSPARRHRLLQRLAGAMRPPFGTVVATGAVTGELRR